MYGIAGDGWPVAPEGEYGGIELALEDGAWLILPCFGWAIRGGVGASRIGKSDLCSVCGSCRAGNGGVPAIPGLILRYIPRCLASWP